MHLTSLTLDAPGQMLATYLVADEPQAFATLRERFPQTSASVSDDDLVHVLSEHGVRAQILRQDVSELIAAQAGAAAGRSTYGDLFRYDTYVFTPDARQGQFMRPATALEAAYSRSCARLDGGLGVFGVHAAPTADRERSRPAGPNAWRRARAAFIHYGTPEWDQALLTSSVRYYRVDAIPADADLPPVELPCTAPAPGDPGDPGDD
ncbi:hypothetical protein Kisp01_67700 [Kineosporia sp. NBRC 101677]|uniref:hypothetical protein n=1 Tax=Kineosporia sp. NBRC 101677 TaxID=3032197 RepID=UPI0024A27BC0|nr:hypothetical protein [Kineosporia sp. NBRC 101677]GLY19756.1 hypothetical protein Kisp01_67700 [Kineosporia sp. NBRC 101677]